MIEPGQSLGLMIRGGIEYGLGIYVTGVDKDSVSDIAGLCVRYLLEIILVKSSCDKLRLYSLDWRSNSRGQWTIIYECDTR